MANKYKKVVRFVQNIMKLIINNFEFKSYSVDKKEQMQKYIYFLE